MLKILTPMVILIAISISLFILQERKVFDVNSLVHIDPVPYTKLLMQKNKYVEAEEYLSFFMQQEYVQKNAEAKELLESIVLKRTSYSYQAEKFFEGIFEGGSDEDIGKVSALVTDFFVIGDIRDLSKEGIRYAYDERVDGFVVALSSLGLLATATTFYSMGTTASIKSSITLLKYGQKMNKIPKWFQREIVNYAKTTKDVKSLYNIEILLTPIVKLYDTVGLNQTLNILKKSKSLKELNALVEFSSRFGKNSHPLLVATNNRAFEYAMGMPKVSNKNFIFASSYGENGLKGLSRMGENKFMRRLGFYSNFTKTSYKGNLNTFWNYLLKKIPTYWLFIISFLGLFYFVYKFVSFLPEKSTK